PVEALENGTANYSDVLGKTIRVLDTIPPGVSEQELAEDNINVNTTAVFEVTASDNVGVDQVIATVVNTTGPPANYSLRLRTGTEEEGIWRLSYDQTDDTGTYNITDLYVLDDRNNTYYDQPGKTFTVSELTVNLSLNTSTAEIGEPVRIGVNVSGNTSSVSSVEANLAKPRGVMETLELERSESLHEYTAVYRNVSRSGNYTVTAVTTLENGLTARSTATFNVSFGQPGVSPISGNGTHVLLPDAAAPYNLTWKILPIGGDTMDVNVSIKVGDTSILQVKGNHSVEVGNVTVEEGYEMATFNLSFQSQGTTTLTVTANSSRNRMGTKTVTALVGESDTEQPDVAAFTESPSRLNQLQNVTLHVNATDLSPIKNVTLVVQHPRNGSGYTEAPVAMRPVSRGVYRYSFGNIAGNAQHNVSRSFNVSASYHVNLSVNHDIFIKGETATFDLTVTDVNGDPVENYNLDFILNKAGTNATLFTNRKKERASYEFKESDPPTFSDPGTKDKLPLTYTAYANVTKNGNSGFASLSFEVTRILDVAFIEPSATTIPPNTTFEFRVRITGPRGNPISGKFTTNCNDCPPDPAIKGLTP
ncbi:MAG: hypothetical protein SVU32_00510, partial [Candidatus Nanohaloarchaea archaeon]|nr:hypothetical protein [Candidatus Nanohaloarchaea archaeon]